MMILVHQPLAYLNQPISTAKNVPTFPPVGHNTRIVRLIAVVWHRIFDISLVIYLTNEDKVGCLGPFAFGLLEVRLLGLR